VEFAPGRGAIHLHVVAIAKDRAYLQDFFKASTLEEKAKVLYSLSAKSVLAGEKLVATYSIST
jgi:hypothetical protein